MKIEKLNERQIRCTLTREDLAGREIKLSELAYGTEKAKNLFRDMMQQAADDFGFEANNTPLMIEAIPLSADSIILIITKVDDPEELDTRFSRFSPEDSSGYGRDLPSLAELLTGADDIVDIVNKILEAGKMLEEKNNKSKAGSQEAVKEGLSEDNEASEEVYRLTRFYLFHDLESVIRVSRILSPEYLGPNALFKNPEENKYYLLLKKADTDTQLFNQVCNILSEYALQVNYTPGMEEYFTEHMDVIIPELAVQKLAGI